MLKSIDSVVTFPVFIVTDGESVRLVETNETYARSRAEMANAMLRPDDVPFTVEQCLARLSPPSGRVPPRFA